MPAPRSHGLPSQAVCSAIVVAMLAMIAIPAALTLHTVHSPVPIMPVNQSSSPYGYTVSLLLFIFPITAIAGWFLPNEGLHIPQRAFWRTIAILIPAGFALDLFFARWFFYYPNVGATLGIHVFAFGRPVPIEEYIFYVTGFLGVLLLYIWLGEFWLAAYNVVDYPGEARKMQRLLAFHSTSLILAIALVGAAWFYKKHFALPADRAGFPGYFTVLVLGGLSPSVSFFRASRRFINWRALSLTLFFMLLVSVLWEATLAVPYGWWRYEHRQMMGLFIGAWSGLPIEGVCVWIAVTYATVIVFEAEKIRVACKESIPNGSRGKAEVAAG
jgi:type IV secretory pathway protease TraF